MSAPLTINAACRAYPAGVVSNVVYEDYYLHFPKEEAMEPVHSSEGLPAEEEKNPHNLPDSPKFSNSGIFTRYTPDSATSPNKQPPSPQLTSTPQKHKIGSTDKKGKTRTVFSQEQLQILHHRFQSQKYLSPQQIRELGSVLGLTYKQVKTWFQNQRMKFKRTQKEALWMKKGMCQPQNACLDINPSYHQGYTINDARNIHSLAHLHESCGSTQSYANNQNYSSDHSQLYASPQSYYPIVSGEDGSFFGKAAGACFGQQAISYIGQQKMNFYHGFSASVEYAAVKMEDNYPFSNVSTTAAAFPGTAVLQHYQAPLQTPGAQSNYNT
ncbi:homeobox protein NANOG-like [Hemicordylus capensis]|uniref:homeobox protein NANOG-like n=1 Tax=Hemicordylus capensis TaxID=884348 RepID=UPI002302E49A|nr:homeobox protein NANOG-like [Hemicordylus capensis]